MGAACDGVDFSGAVVAGMQLQGATLKNAKFAGVNLWSPSGDWISWGH